MIENKKNTPDEFDLNVEEVSEEDNELDDGYTSNLDYLMSAYYAMSIVGESNPMTAEEAAVIKRIQRRALQIADIITKEVHAELLAIVNEKE